MISGRVCATCGGYGVRPMNEAEQRDRRRVLRVHKRQNSDPPPRNPIQCEPCNGRGWLKED